MAGRRGMGHIFKRGEVYWIKYSVQGKSYRESSHSEKEADAKRLMKKRLGEAASAGTISKRRPGG